MKYLWLGLLLLPFLLHVESSDAFVTGSCQDDFNHSHNVTIADVVLMGPAFNKIYPDPAYHPRFDLNADNRVTLADVVLMGPGFNLPCDGGEYVKAFGQTLYTPSDPAYRFTGVNRYNLLTNNAGGLYQGCGGTWTEAQIETWFAELEAQNVEAVRLWAFQKFIYEGATPYWGRLDYALGAADRHAIRLIPVLENQWDGNAPASITDCTEGGYRYEGWYAGGYLGLDNDGVGSGHSLSFRDYVSVIVDRYKDDDRIAFWQIMNEAEISSGSEAVLRAMADDVASSIQAVDPNHLVTFGVNGSGQWGTQLGEYKTLHALASIDICEYHDFHHPTEAIPTGPSLLSTRLTQCAELGKPIFVGESGIDWAEYGLTKQQRADYFAAKMSAFYGAGGDGYLIWSYRDRYSTDSLEYDAADPLAGVVSSW